MTDLVEATFVERLNRFVVRIRLPDGPIVRAYLPNTGRLTHLTEPGRPWILRRDGTPTRSTEYTAIRAWDGCWVALEASRAPAMLADWLRAGNPFPGFGSVTAIETEVTLGRHRLDLRLTTDRSVEVWVEVKSGGRAAAGVALLSQTPSARGSAHLAALGKLVEEDRPAAVAFVVQRPDVDELGVGGDADPEWVRAVRSARAAGVEVMAFRCDVTPEKVGIDRALPIRWKLG